MVIMCLPSQARPLCHNMKYKHYEGFNFSIKNLVEKHSQFLDGSLLLLILLTNKTLDRPVYLQLLKELIYFKISTQILKL